jgi:hypothetical protein
MPFVSGIVIQQEQIDIPPPMNINIMPPSHPVLVRGNGMIIPR